MDTCHLHIIYNVHSANSSKLFLNDIILLTSINVVLIYHLNHNKIANISTMKPTMRDHPTGPHIVVLYDRWFFIRDRYKWIEMQGHVTATLVSLQRSVSHHNCLSSQVSQYSKYNNTI